MLDTPSYRKGWKDGFNGREFDPGELGLFDTDDDTKEDDEGETEPDPEEEGDDDEGESEPDPDGSDYSGSKPLTQLGYGPVIAGWIAGFLFLEIGGAVMAHWLRPVLGDGVPDWLGFSLFAALWTGAILFGVAVTKLLRTL